MKLVDTSVAADFLRGFGSAVALLEDMAVAGEVIAASEVTRFEVLTGARPRDLAEIEQFFLALDWVPVTGRIARGAASYARQYRRGHSGIDMADYLVAATAAELGAGLLTMNVRHFPMLTGLAAAYSYG